MVQTKVRRLCPFVTLGSSVWNPGKLLGKHGTCWWLLVQGKARGRRQARIKPQDSEHMLCPVPGAASS